VDTTPVSLLQRLRQPGQREAWSRFVDLYGPLLLYWARRAGLSEEDAADAVQDLFIRLVEELPRFTYDPGRRFRGWLYTVARNHLRNRLTRSRHVPIAGDASPDDLPGPDPAADVWEREHRQFLVRRALEVMRADFEPATVQACWQLVVEGRPAAEVGAALGLSANAVYLARLRVLRRLRQELEGLLD
jgi:RNA polymerase sigma-70 factor (ECF subfamily)